jgi:flagellar motor switch protein FliG
MNIKQLMLKGVKLLVAISCIVFVAYFGYKYVPKQNNFPYLPKESILKQEVQREMRQSINSALKNILDTSDFELVLHINLNEDEISEELITYKPKEVAINEVKKDMAPIPKVNLLPGLIDHPFHNESLPGFPSYFDQYDIEKDDYVTRGLFAKILTTAYQLPKDTPLLTQGSNIVDTNETEFAEDINIIVEKDIIKTYPTGEYRPNQFISKTDMISALVKLNYEPKPYNTTDVISELPYKDINKNHWAYSSIKTALENNLIEEDIIFNPNQKITVNELILLIEKTPNRTDMFNYYKFPKYDTNEQFETKNKTETQQTNIYYDQEKTTYKSPSTKIKRISVRILINEMILSETISLKTVEDIVRNVIEFDEERKDTLIITSYPFTKLPLIIKVIKWKHWQKLYGVFGLCLALYILNGLKKILIKAQEKKRSKRLSKEEQENKLSKIYEEEEYKSAQRLTDDLLKDVKSYPKKFALKLEKWVELLQNSPQYENDPKAAYEKIGILILFLDAELPGITGEIIKGINKKHVKETLHAIENISKVNTVKTRACIIEFSENLMTQGNLYGGKTATEHIIDTSFSETEKQNIFNVVEKTDSFEFLNTTHTQQLVEIITNENTGVGTFILSKCNDERIMEITEKLPKEVLKKIAAQLIYIKSISFDFLLEYEQNLKKRILKGEKSIKEKSKIQIQKASAVFETLPKDIRLSIFSSLKQTNPETLEAILNSMFVFEDIVKLNDVDIQAIIFEIKDMSVLSKSLKKASTELVEKFKNNMSERLLNQFNTTDTELSQVVDDEIDDAQYQVVRALRELEKNERIAKLSAMKRDTNE